MKRWLKRIRSITVSYGLTFDGETTEEIGWSWCDMYGEDDRLYATKLGAWISAVVS